MFLATLLFPGRDWLLPAAGFIGVASLLLWWSYRHAQVSSGLRALCVALKLLGLLALAACLLEPLWSRPRAQSGANFFAILADNSQSLQIKDRGSPKSRGENLRALVTQAPWANGLGENFQLRRYLFDTRLQSTRDFSELAFDGRATSLGAALRTLADRFHGQPLAGVLLLTDGNATDLTDAAPDLSGLPPIYPVVIGNDDPIKDIALPKIVVNQTAFEDAPVTIQAEVSTSGYADKNVVVQLIQTASSTRPATNATNVAVASEKIIAEQTQKAPRDGETLAFRFQVKPEQAGLSFYRVQVAARDEIGQFLDPAVSTEATLANNRRVAVVDRGRGPYRILYVSGRPNWEYKFLQRALLADDQIQLVGLIRIARREPKFDFRGRAGESSNPLFRGFGNQSKDEVERYDQPVLVRLNTRDETELSGGFPKLPEDLYSYHAVILDDLESEFFTPDQMTLLQKFVSERGGGFLMLGGAESFQNGKYHRTPVGDLLPVYLDQPADDKPPGELRLTLTREGWLQPWARLRDNESAEKIRLENTPPFGVLNHVRAIKPGASTIATVTDGGGAPLPALVAQRYGHGRSAALTLGDFWHWGLKDEASHRDMDKAWRQLMRWLVADVPGRIQLQVEASPGDAAQSVLLQVRARDKNFQPLDNAAVTLHVRAASGTNTVRINAEPALNEAGLYQATYIPRDTGGYHAETIVADANGLEVGRTEAGWTSDPAAEEFRSLKPNRALLETIARQSGGEIVPAEKLAPFIATLPNRRAPMMENSTSPLWHQASVFLFALACFIAEWGLRRWRGLA